MGARATAEQLTDLVDAVVRLNGILLAEGDALTSPFGLTAARWLVLGALVDSPISVSEVARRRGLTRQSVRESAMRLERDGFVIRVANPVDARAPLVGLTPKAREFLAQIEPVRAEWAERLASSIGQSELAATLSVLRELSATVAS